MLRRLDPDEDETLFMQMYGWLEDSPRWRQDSESVWAPEDYLAATHDPTRIDVGVFEDDGLVANITLYLRSVGLYEAHMEASPRAKVATVVAAGREAGEWMFNAYGAQQVYVWVAKFNRPMRRIIKAIGFGPTHITMHRGISHGKLIEWQQFSMSEA